MKIVTWNAWVKNLDQKKNLIDLIQFTKADVLCLQEVESKLLSYLKKNSLGFKIKYTEDYRKKRNGSWVTYYLVMLSRFPFSNKRHHFAVHEFSQKSLWDTLNKWEESIRFMYGDVSNNGCNYRIFNVHMEVSAGPLPRIKQFRKTLEHFSKTKKNIIAGDFNIFFHPILNPFVFWLFGANPRDIFVHERKWFEREFRLNNLVNPFSRNITYPKFRLQLDHILTPEDLKIKDKHVFKNRFGSDHRPLLLEIKKHKKN
jgi:endonuclease/exonuclease/phosphatase family metal-dependent hydrolase